MLFINTRPIDRALALTQKLQHVGIEVLPLPLLQLQPCALDAQLQALYHALPRSQVIVVVSPTAVTLGMQYLQATGLQASDLSDITWVAVGKKTAQVLASYGISSVVPDLETSEGMLALDTFVTLKAHDQVAFWRGEGGRQLMMQQLQTQDIDILNFVLYRRSCPELSPAVLNTLKLSLQQQHRPVVLISSEASWENWCQLLQQHAIWLTQVHYLVLGERLAACLAHTGVRQNIDFSVQILLDLSPEHIVYHLLKLQGSA